MKRTGTILALIAVGSLLGASDLRAGSAGAPAGKTTGSSMTATIVMDLTGTGTTPPKGLTSIRIQRSGGSQASLFNSGIVFGKACDDASVVGDTNGRFVGNMNGWVPQSVLTALFQSAANKAVITDTDYAACTTVNFGTVAAPVLRQYLSFTAVIQFEK